MGRTNPTYRDRLSALEDEWSEFRRGLRYERQADFDRLFEQARSHAHAAGYQNHEAPEIALLLSVLLAHERRIDDLEDRLDDDADLEDRLDDDAERDDSGA